MGPVGARNVASQNSAACKVEATKMAMEPTTSAMSAPQSASRLPRLGQSTKAKDKVCAA